MRVNTSKSHADLAGAHLAHIWDRTRTDVDRVIFAVPGSFGKEQLGLLLEIARELSIPMSGMIDAALAATPCPYPGRTLLHLDVQLHRMVLTHLEQGEQLTRGNAETLDGSGLVSFYETWGRVIADAFVRSTRFDPFHGAATEQELYNRLPAWLETLQQEAATALEMQAGGNVYRVAMSNEQIAGAIRWVSDQVVKRVSAARRGIKGVVVQASHRLRHIPGLLNRLTQLPNCEVSTLGLGAAALGAVRYADVIASPSRSVGLTTKLPWSDEWHRTGQPRGRADRPSTHARPTHVVYQGLAYPVGGTPCVVGHHIPPHRPGIAIVNSSAGISRVHCSIIMQDDEVLLEDQSTYGTFVNDRRVEHTTILRTGDTVRIGSPGEQLHLIRVVPPNEA